VSRGRFRGGWSDRLWLLPEPNRGLHVTITSSTDFVREGLEQLIASLGLREPIPLERFAQLHAAREPKAFATAVARQMSLPIDVSLSGTFVSSDLVKTHAGRAVQGIEAQVSLPANIPVFGSRELDGYSIVVTLGSRFAEATPETATALLAHEFSHVLLHALRHPKRDSEVFTDLVPLVLGFVNIVERGRRVSSVSHEGSVTRTTTTTYGYLSDSDFALAVAEVNRTWNLCVRSKLRLLERVDVVTRKTARNRALLNRFGEMKTQLDGTLKTVRTKDSTLIVAMHSADFTHVFELTVRRANDVVVRAEQVAQSAVSYSSTVVTELDHQYQACAAMQLELDEQCTRMRMHNSILARNLGLHYRVREWRDRVGG
jgi:hypothetical protein